MSNAPLVGYSVTGAGPVTRGGNRNDIYYIYFKQNNYTIHNDSRKPKSKVIITNENLDVYCVSVSTGIIMVRGSKGISTICGNCAMLEHGTVYLTFDNTIIQEQAYIDFFNRNPYSTVVYTYDVDKPLPTKAHITTNLRVLYENNYINLLDRFMCNPSAHKRRITVSFTTNIGVSREFNRHRVNSAAEESTRYCNYNKRNSGQLKIVLPAWLLNEENLPYIETHQFDKFSSYIEDIFGQTDDELLDNWCDIDFYLFGITTAQWCYNMLIKKGWKPQQAREVLPLATKTQLIHTAFIDDWKHFFALRADGVSGAPHPNAALVAKPLKEEFIKLNLIEK